MIGSSSVASFARLLGDLFKVRVPFPLHEGIKTPEEFLGHERCRDNGVGQVNGKLLDPFQGEILSSSSPYVKRLVVRWQLPFEVSGDRSSKTKWIFLTSYAVRHLAIKY